jgi:hypothetical protein
VQGAAGPTAIVGEPGHGGAREVGQNGEETVGNRFRPHLGRGRPVEVDRRWRADCGNGGSGGGAAELGREMEVAGEVHVAVEGDAGPFIGGDKGRGWWPAGGTGSLQ